MRQKLFSIGLAVAVGFTTIMISTIQAEARHRLRHPGFGVGLAAGIAGGLIVGGAIAHSGRRVSTRHCHRGYCHRHFNRSRHSHRRSVIVPVPVLVAPPVYRGGNSHVRYCFNRYRSYRQYDNSYNPGRGRRRRQCRSRYN